MGNQFKIDGLRRPTDERWFLKSTETSPNQPHVGCSPGARLNCWSIFLSLSLWMSSSSSFASIFLFFFHVQADFKTLGGRWQRVAHCGHSMMVVCKSCLLASPTGPPHRPWTSAYRQQPITLGSAVLLSRASSAAVAAFSLWPTTFSAELAALGERIRGQCTTFPNRLIALGCTSDSI